MHVVEDYRERIIVDPDSPILALKASRDRYIDPSRQKQYAGKPYLSSKNSEDALTWNVFRTLQETGRLDIVSDILGIGQPKGLLLWTLAPKIDDVNACLQYVTGSLIREFDGVFRGQMTEPDIVLLGTTGIAVIECKLSERDKTASHLWEGRADSVKKRLPVYTMEIPNLVRTSKPEEIVNIYQLVRMAFYAVKLAEYFRVEPVVVSLANEKNWTIEIRRLRKTPAQLWDMFCNEILGQDILQCKAMTWQGIAQLTRGVSTNTLWTYLSNHPCL